MWQEESDESSANADSGEEEDIAIQAAKEAEVEKLETEVSTLSKAATDVNEESPSASNNDSDYEQSNKDDSSDNEEEDEEKSSASSSSSSTTPPPKKSRKLDAETRKLLEEENYLRRSSRSKANDQARKKQSSSEEPESSSDDHSEFETSPRKRSKRSKQQDNKRVYRVAVNKSVNYKEKDTDEDVDENDVLEWEEESTLPDVSTLSAPGAETIEKVLKSRIGFVGATGSSTTCYNIAERGDPNCRSNDEETPLETQYLIKWVGWSHLHNTWESEDSLAQMGASGIKKIANFKKKAAEIDHWRRTADKEYVEFFDCEQVMSDELYEEYKNVDRIVAHQVSRDKTNDGVEATEYYVKWSGLSYADCTWEDERLLPKEKLEDYHERTKNYKSPSKNAAVLRKRPRFLKLEETPSFLQPRGKDGQCLRDYQLEGVNWMIHAWCKGNSAILADEMGLGKTIQSISFLSSLYHRYDLYGPYLVVVPLSTMAAWQKEFAQWAPDLNVITYMGDGQSREQIRQFEWYLPGTKKMKVNAVLTTYEILLKDKTFLGSFAWAALAVDEAHRLKNDESLLYKCLSQFNTDHRLLITGTPLQNSLKELWALLHFIMPEKFNSWEEFENDHNDKDHKGISALHKKLEPFLLRRVKKDVEKSLPPKLEQILRVDMTAQQKQYYKWILTKNYRELSKGVKGSINGFVNLVMELKKCCNHTSLVRQYDYHENEAQARLQQLLKSSGKLILLDKLLVRLRDTGHRVLIFSQMVMMLDILQEYLQLRRFPSQRLDGSMRADLRKQALDHFNAEGSQDFCFLLSTRAGGLGINLATADTVIIFDSDWNPQNDLQAMSRAHRIGQTKQVNIYRFVTRTSVEEEIVERAKRKLVLDHLVIQRMDTSGRTVLSKTSNSSVPFDKHELNAILKFGAAELFKEKEGEEQEPEVDIDRILSVAETREAEENNQKADDLLGSFKYANFTFDEEKDVAEAAASKVGENEWDDIIPEEQRLRVEEEERQKVAAELELAPRQRSKVVEVEETGNDNDGSDSDSSNSDAEGSSKKKRKKAWGDFSGAEVKRFVRSFRKFAKPLERLEALAQDAELEEHSTAELARLGEALIDGCQKAETEYNSKKQEHPVEKKEGGKLPRDKGPIFKFANVADVNVRQIKRLHHELEPLHNMLSSNPPITCPPKARAQKGWDVEWTSVDDLAILRGVYKYGMGSWESVKMDPELGLADKIFLKDKVRKPQRVHVQQRLEYLLKLLRNNTGQVREHKKIASSERKRKVPDEKKTNHEKKKKDKSEGMKEDNSFRSSFADQLAVISIDKGLYASALDNTSEKPFTDCVKMMRPVQKYIKRLKEDPNDDKEAMRCLMKLGDNCRDQLEDLVKRKPKTNVRKWYSYLWIFLSKFVSKDPVELLEKYRSHPQLHKHNHHHHNNKSDSHSHGHHEKSKRDKDRREPHYNNHSQKTQDRHGKQNRTPLKDRHSLSLGRPSGSN